MKKIIYSLSTIAIFCVSGQAQNVIPNGGFENWTNHSYEIPQSYIQCSNLEAIQKCGCPPNEVKSTSAYHGSFALQLTTQIANGDTNVGYCVAANAQGNPNQWSGGLPYTQQPTGIRGYYKCSVPAGDSALMLLQFKKSGTSLGFIAHSFYGTHNSYTLFSVAFPPLGQNPDTVQIGFTSSDFKDNIAMAGSTLTVDSVSFTGASQPANFDGDFENWVTVPVMVPVSWYANNSNSGDAASIAVFQTTDKQAGTYAAEMKTYKGDRGNGNGPSHSVAQGGSVSTGYQLNQCGGSNCTRGGSPFSGQVDTLCFYFKYAPMGNDSASVDLNFRKNGIGVWGVGKNFGGTVSTYSYTEVPIHTGGAVDTVVVSFESSLNQDTAFSFIGSDLKVDEVHFKSQGSLGIKLYDPNAGIKVFPNPAADGNFVMSNVDRFDLVRVLNVFGQEVNAEIIKENGTAKIHVATAGAYFVYVNSRGKTTTQKIIVGKE
jgi:hypothetical protein